MPETRILEIEGVFALPPLILHPFTESASTVQVLESAKASLTMLGDGDGAEEDSDIRRKMLEGRFTEFRMLYYVGKDVCRWLDQCVDHCSRSPELAPHRVSRQSFSQLLIDQTPEDVAAKLRSWGVVEFARIFSRSIGIFAQFKQPPLPDMLQDDYLRYYYRYADYAYAAWRDLRRGYVLRQEQFPFTLYASGEYTRMLEEEWKEGCAGPAGIRAGTNRYLTGASGANPSLTECRCGPDRSLGARGSLAARAKLLG